MRCTRADAGHVFLVVHNIDGLALRSAKVQTILSMLACVRGLHIIASIDHVNAHLRQFRLTATRC